jgi:DNA-binding transcriptional ArsR family regulator
MQAATASGAAGKIIRYLRHAARKTPDSRGARAQSRTDPGVTCREIADGIGERAAIVSVELKALRAAGMVQALGNTRGTRWRVVGRR